MEVKRPAPGPVRPCFDACYRFYLVLRTQAPPSSIDREKRNWLIHLLYTRQEFTECLKLIGVFVIIVIFHCLAVLFVELTLEELKGQSEYALYVKALIRRQQGGCVVC